MTILTTLFSFPIRRIVRDSSSATMAQRLSKIVARPFIGTPATIGASWKKIQSVSRRTLCPKSVKSSALKTLKATSFSCPIPKNANSTSSASMASQSSQDVPEICCSIMLSRIVSSPRVHAASIDTQQCWTDFMKSNETLEMRCSKIKFIFYWKLQIIETNCVVFAILQVHIVELSSRTASQVRNTLLAHIIIIAARLMRKEKEVVCGRWALHLRAFHVVVEVRAPDDCTWDACCSFYFVTS